MGEHRRKADGRRVFSTEFKRTTVQRILTGEKTLAELSRELDISPSVIRNWKRFAEAGATTAVQASEDVVPASHVREAYAKIWELALCGRRARRCKRCSLANPRAVEAHSVSKKSGALQCESFGTLMVSLTSSAGILRHAGKAKNSSEPDS